MNKEYLYHLFVNKKCWRIRSGGSTGNTIILWELFLLDGTSFHVRAGSKIEHNLSQLLF